MPAFKKPKSKNAATTLALLGGIAVTMIMGVIVLANTMGLSYAEDPADAAAAANGRWSALDYVQDPVIGQLAEAVFDASRSGSTSSRRRPA